MATYEIKREENIGVSFSNLSDLSFGYNSSLYTTLSKIAQDIYWKVCKKVNVKISKKVKDENNNLIILVNNKKENKDIFSMQAYTSNSTRPFYLQVTS